MDQSHNRLSQISDNDFKVTVVRASPFQLRVIPYRNQHMRMDRAGGPRQKQIFDDDILELVESLDELIGKTGPLQERFEKLQRDA